jgi:OOP family OmpA-OmpF porin
MKPIARLIIAAFAGAALIPASVMAASNATNDGYVIDSHGERAIVRSGFGLCWHDSQWTPGDAEVCDPTSKPAAVVPPAPAAVIAPPPPAAPIAQAQAAKPLPQKISFSGDALFAFDKAVLKPKGKEMLDGLVRQLNDAHYDSIVATGHTDRFGSPKYNQRLSERRANAVKDYLVSKGIRASAITTEGKGETQPVTKAGECRGAKSAKVVACLQPDRRVDIQMTGSKTIASIR